MNILANDGIAKAGIEILEKAGHTVFNTNVAQEQLANFIKTENISVLLVRSATKVPKELLKEVPSIKIVGRGGVGLDNIDVAYANANGVTVINTPDASSASVAELTFAHLYDGVRFLYDSNRNMPLEGDSNFKGLKKAYASGTELRGKTIGIIGFGKIGQETAKIALGVGMNVLFVDTDVKESIVSLAFYDGQTIDFNLKGSTMDHLLKQSDFISLHVPKQNGYVIGKSELEKVKHGVGIVNTARGGAIDEVALIDALEEGRVSFAGLDVYESEPKPEIRILMHPNISLTPHIGAATFEAQERIGISLAEQIISLSIK